MKSNIQSFGMICLMAAAGGAAFMRFSRAYSEIGLGIVVVLIVAGVVCHMISPPGQSALPDRVPVWVYAAGGLASATGAALFFFLGMREVNLYTTFGVILLAGGMVFIAGAKAALGGSAVRRRMAYGVMKIASFFMMAGGALLGILTYVGAFEGGREPLCWSLAAALLLAGMAMLYHGASRSEFGTSVFR